MASNELFFLLEVDWNIKVDFSKYNGEGTELRKAQNRLLEMLIEFDRICKKHNIAYFLSGGTCLGAVRHGGFVPWDDDVDVDVWHTDYNKLQKVLPRELPDQFVMQTRKTDKGCFVLYTKIVDRNSSAMLGNEDRVRGFIKERGLYIDVLPIRRIHSFRIKRLIDRLYRPAFYIMKTRNRNKIKIGTSIILYPVMRAAAASARSFKIFLPREKVSHEYGTGMTPRLSYSTLFPARPICFEGYEFMGPAKPHLYLEGLYGDYMKLPPDSERKQHAETIKVYG